MSYKLFLDDERMPPDDGDSSWVIMRSSASAQLAVEALGLPSFISFDHDLGGADTGMIFLHGLIEYCISRGENLDNVGYFVHSQNPIGKRNIEGLMESFKRSTQLL